MRNNYRFVPNKWLKELYMLSYHGNTLYGRYAQYEQGCVVQGEARYIFSTREDVQYESGTSSVKARMCITNQAHHQYKQGCVAQSSRSSSFGKGGTAQKYFPVNESFIILTNISSKIN